MGLKVYFKALILNTLFLSSGFACIACSTCGYVGSNQSIPYVGIYNVSWGGILATNLWDEASFKNGVFFGFPFKFCGQTFTMCNVNSNGYIWFGTGNPPASGATDVLSLPSLGANNYGVIAACGRDLTESSSLSAYPVPDNAGWGPRAVRYHLFGSAPNRYVVIEYIGFYPKLNCAAGGADNHRLDFQIILYEDGGIYSNRIEIIYRDQSPFCNDKAYSFQVGVRGADPADFACRKQGGGNLTSSSSSAGTSNTDKIVFNPGDHISGTDVAFRFDYLPGNIPVTASPDTSICKGIAAQLYAAGGISYIWTPAAGLSSSTIPNPVATPSVTTTYYVYATDSSGCQGVDTVTVKVNPSPAISITADTAICSGESIQLKTSGGLSYQWSPAAGLDNPSIADPVANPSATTTYSVTVENIDGCISQDSVAVTVNSLPVITAGPDTTICSGSAVQLFAAGGVIYDWSPAASLSNPAIQDPFAFPLATTTYSVNVTDSNGCKSSESVTVGTYQGIPTPLITQYMDTLFCSTDPSYFHYQWYRDTANIVGATDTFMVISGSGNYNVQITDQYGCSIAVGINIIVTAVDIYSEDNSLAIYPNPAKDHILIKRGDTLSKDKVILSILNVLGEIVYSLRLTESTREIEIDINYLPEGIYLLQIQNSDHIMTGKFIKQ